MLSTKAKQSFGFGETPLNLSKIPRNSSNPIPQIIIIRVFGTNSIHRVLKCATNCDFFIYYSLLNNVF